MDRRVVNDEEVAARERPCENVKASNNSNNEHDNARRDRAQITRTRLNERAHKAKVVFGRIGRVAWRVEDNWSRAGQCGHHRDAVRLIAVDGRAFGFEPLPSHCVSMRPLQICVCCAHRCIGKHTVARTPNTRAK